MRTRSLRKLDRIPDEGIGGVVLFETVAPRSLRVRSNSRRELFGKRAGGRESARLVVFILPCLYQCFFVSTIFGNV